MSLRFFDFITQNLKKIFKYIETKSVSTSAAEDAEKLNCKESLHHEISPIISRTAKTLGAILAVFLLWISFAPIDSAAIAPGVVVVLSNRKTVQHLEGGIISEILVKEGDEVEKDQPLLILSDTASKARYTLLSGQWNAAKAVESRLLAERNQAAELVFDPQISAQENNPEMQKHIDGQQQLFKARQQAFKSQLETLTQRILQHRKQMEGIASQESAAKQQLDLLIEEEESTRKLFQEGLALKSRLLQLNREIADLKGKRSDFKAQYARLKETITETKTQMDSLHHEYMKEVEQNLKETQTQLHDIQEELQAAKDVMNRTLVKSPQSGVVTGLTQHTIGGVIAPGAPILDIVPKDDLLVVEAQVSPQDIDVVRVGLTAKISFSAYKSRLVPRIEGKIIHVSADRFTDERSGLNYYQARIEVNSEALAKLSSPIKLYPGMPAETFIITGSRTMLKYLLAPIKEGFHRAFKEE